jgi:hypothetical protein
MPAGCQVDALFIISSIAVRRKGAPAAQNYPIQDEHETSGAVQPGRVGPDLDPWLAQLHHHVVLAHHEIDCFHAPAFGEYQVNRRIHPVLLSHRRNSGAVPLEPRPAELIQDRPSEPRCFSTISQSTSGKRNAALVVIGTGGADERCRSADLCAWNAASSARAAPARTFHVCAVDEFYVIP